MHNPGFWVGVREWCVHIPNVRHCSEHAIFQRLWRHPADWQQALSSFSVVIRLINISGHAKIWKKREKTEVGKAFKYHLFCVREAAPESSSIPSPSPSLCPSTLKYSASGAHWNPSSYFSSPVQRWATRGSCRHTINLTYLRSSQWSPQLPCSFWQPGLCGQICWHLGTTCRRQFPLPSGSSFWAGVGPGWWRSGDNEKTRYSQPHRWTVATAGHYKVRYGCYVKSEARENKCGQNVCVWLRVTIHTPSTYLCKSSSIEVKCVCSGGCVRKCCLLLCAESAGGSWDLLASSAP